MTQYLDSLLVLSTFVPLLLFGSVKSFVIAWKLSWVNLHMRWTNINFAWSARLVDVSRQ